jgi:hypothetical protein
MAPVHPSVALTARPLNRQLLLYYLLWSAQQLKALPSAVLTRQPNIGVTVNQSSSLLHTMGCIIGGGGICYT